MEPVVVTFLGSAVRVLADDPAIAETLRRNYRHLSEGPHVGRAVELELRASDDTYACLEDGAPIASRLDPSSAIRWARQRILEHFIAARGDLLWLHGAAATLDGKALLIPGPRGRGKSTLVTALCADGWRFLGDDTVPLDPRTLELHPFPRAPEVREAPSVAMPERWLLDAQKVEHEVADRIERAPRPLGGILLPFASRGAEASVTPCTPGEALAVIAQGCWNVADHEATIGATMSRLVTAVPVGRVAFDDGPSAAAPVRAWMLTR